MNITRSRTNRILAGVLGGIAESLGMNATLVRILFLVLLFSTAFFPMTVLYLIMVFVLSNKEGY